MVSRVNNERMCLTAADVAAGKLLLLYWQPVALAEELAGSLADLLQPDRQQQASERSDKELRRHHEGRQDFQEYIDKVSTFFSDSELARVRIARAG